MSETDSSPRLDWSDWPYLFQEPKLTRHCYRVNDLAEKRFDPRANAADRYALEKQLRDALEAATNDFYRKFPPRPETERSAADWRRFHDAEKFLEELDRTIATAAETKTFQTKLRKSYFEQYAPEDRNCASLIQYMSRHGLSFDKAPVGAEVVYDRLFLQMRDLARTISAAPSRDQITEPMINLESTAPWPANPRRAPF